MDNTVKKLNVAYLDQSAEAPTGCESVSAVMLLNYLGFPVGIREFIGRYLEKGSFHREDGTVLNCSIFQNESTEQGLLPDGTKLFGPDPRKAFAGDPFDPEAMGCYAPVIVSALNRVFAETPAYTQDGTPGSRTAGCSSTDPVEMDDAFASGAGPGIRKWTAFDETGKDLKELVLRCVGELELPLLVWCTIDRKEAVEGPRWYLADGSLFTWRSNEHCVLLTGFDEENYIINDPWANEGVIAVEQKLFERGWRQEHSQTVAVTDRGYVSCGKPGETSLCWIPLDS